jgi:predicted secreted protein
MASTGKYNGTALALYLGGTKITHLTSNDFSLEQALRDATTKDSAGWEEVLEGLRSATFSCEGYFAEDAAKGFEDFTALLITTRGTGTVRWSSEVSTDTYWEATCYVESQSLSAPTEETATFSISLKVTGAVTETTV